MPPWRHPRTVRRSGRWIRVDHHHPLADDVGLPFRSLRRNATVDRSATLSTVPGHVRSGQSREVPRLARHPRRRRASDPRDVDEHPPPRARSSPARAASQSRDAEGSSTGNARRPSPAGDRQVIAARSVRGIGGMRNSCVAAPLGASSAFRRSRGEGGTRTSRHDDSRHPRRRALEPSFTPVSTTGSCVNRAETSSVPATSPALVQHVRVARAVTVRAWCVDHALAQRRCDISASIMRMPCVHRAGSVREHESARPTDAGLVRHPCANRAASRRPAGSRCESCVNRAGFIAVSRDQRCPMSRNRLIYVRKSRVVC